MFEGPDRSVAVVEEGLGLGPMLGWNVCQGLGQRYIGLCGQGQEWANMFNDVWRGMILGKPVTLALLWRKNIFKDNDDDFQNI